MNKAVLSIAIFGALTTGSVFAKAGESSDNTFKGLRIGAGISQTEVEVDFDFKSTAMEDFDYEFDYGEGYKFELGYDFNPVVGVGASYETNSGTIFESAEVDTSTIKLSVDLGYAFSIYSFHFKPYAKLGYKFYLDDTSNWLTEEYNSDDFFYGAGLRLQYRAIYADVTIDRFSSSFEDDDGLIFFDYNYTQMGLTVGYKF